MVDIDGLSFETCYDNRESVILENASVDFMGLDELIIAKNKAARPQDLADAHNLIQIREQNKRS